MTTLSEEAILSFSFLALPSHWVGGGRGEGGGGEGSALKGKAMLP